jgi:glycosyltransferase involved in cell wall biosynthesis
MRTAAIIPALDEAPTVAGVVAAARPVVDEVIVVDNGSSDETATVAAQAGAKVISEPRRGKGEALSAGLRATGAPVVVFLDADLYGLQPDHVHRLVAPVVDGTAEMTRGVLSRGEIIDEVTMSGAVPFITGQRALRRDVFEALMPEHREGFKTEAAIEGFAEAYDLETETVLLDGVGHVIKEEKRGLVEGLRQRWVMVGQVAGMILVAAAVYRWRRLLGRLLPR